MNVIYNSDSYYVVEYQSAGCEVVDKQTARGLFLSSEQAKPLIADLDKIMATANHDPATAVETTDELISERLDFSLGVTVLYH